MKRLSLIMVLAVLLIAGVRPFNYAAHRGVFGDNVRQLSQFFFRRSDLYDPLYREEIVPVEPGAAYSFSFGNRYAGKHKISLLVSRRFDIKRSELYAPYLSSSVVCVSPGYPDFRQTRQGVHSWFWSRDGQGFSLYEYSVPRDFPLDNLVTCELRILEGQEQFWTEYGVHAIDVRKRSEE
jgi:hypothetical protein